MTLPARLVLILISTGLFIGPAIAGEGGFAAYFDHPPLVGLAVLLLLCVAALFAGGNLSTGVREEEHLLQSQFGDEYSAYRRRTWRVLPWVY